MQSNYWEWSSSPTSFTVPTVFHVDVLTHLRLINVRLNVVEVFTLSFHSQTINRVYSGVFQIIRNPVLWSSSVIQGKFLQSRPRLLSCSSTRIHCSRLIATFEVINLSDQRSLNVKTNKQTNGLIFMDLCIVDYSVEIPTR